MCIPPVAPQNGSISPADQVRWLDGDTVTFSCDDRFLLIGEESVTCEEQTSFVNVTTCMGKRKFSFRRFPLVNAQSLIDRFIDASLFSCLVKVTVTVLQSFLSSPYFHFFLVDFPSCKLAACYQAVIILYSQAQECVLDAFGPTSCD